MRKVNGVCKKLVSSEHAQSVAIQDRCDKINRMWNDVKELAQARQEVSEKKIYEIDNNNNNANIKRRRRKRIVTTTIKIMGCGDG